MNNKLRLRGTSIAIGVVLGVVAAAPMAAIVDGGPVNIPIPPNFSGIYMNWVAGTSGSSGAAVPGWDFCAYASAAPGTPTLTFFTSESEVNLNQVVGSGNAVAALAKGTVIGPASNLATAGIVRTEDTAFRTTGTSYVGVAFVNETNATTYYGYAEIQTTAPLGFPATITRVVYENTGQPITIPGASPVLQSVVSRKMHGAAGNFDVVLTPLAPPAINSNPPTEPRQGPALALVFTFDKPIDSAAANVTEGIASGIQIGTNGNDLQMVVNGVADQQYLTVTITAIDAVDGGQGADVSVRIGMLMGDVNGSRVVTLADVGHVNAQLAQLVTASNFKLDVNASGTLTLADKGLTNASLTHSLPPP